jgi:hypothetical protein
MGSGGHLDISIRFLLIRARDGEKSGSHGALGVDELIKGKRVSRWGIHGYVP